MAVPAPAAKVLPRRIAIVCPSGALLRGMRGLLGDMAARGHAVLAVAPDLRDADARWLGDLGAEQARLAGDPAAFRLLGDWKAVAECKSVLAEWEPDTVIACGSQTMVHGALAAKAAGAERIVLVIDALPENRFSGKLSADEMPAWRYGQALRLCQHAVFHSRDDLALLRKLAVVPDSLSVSVLPAAGVDHEASTMQPLPPLADGLVFLMIAPLDHRHGVSEYCEAAALVRRRAPHTRFLLAGLGASGPGAIDAVELAACEDVEFLADAGDHPDLIAAHHVFVYPSVADGMPQPLLDALAAGRPLIVADVPGCRDAVDERVNGCLFEPRNAEALAEAIESYLKRPDLIPSMARASRAKAERMTSASDVRRELLQILHLA